MNATTLETTHLARFATSLRGELLRTGDPDYDEARTIWNAMIDKHPALIARCRDTQDVIHAVNFAREEGLPLSIRGGGHNIAGSALCEDGLVIDLSAMNEVHVDPAKRTARVGPGATLADFDAAAQAHGLATPLGINSTTGVAGLTLGGGFGWLTRKYGVTVDNLTGVDMVTADGRALRADARENPDLYWAVRGGGGNFGVVTGFDFALHPVGPQVLAGIIVYPFESVHAVLDHYRTFAANAPDDLTAWVVLRKAPPLPFLDASVHGREVAVVALCYAGDPEQGRRAAEPLFHFATPHGTHVDVMPYTAWQQAFDALLTPGARNYWKSHNLAALSDEAIDGLIEFAGRLPSAQCEIFLAQLGGAANRVAKDATAYPHRDTEFVLNVHARWEDLKDDTRCTAWAREFFQALAPYAQGSAYVNFMSADEAERVATAYGPTYTRLAELKRRYDPHNLFRTNQNIVPAA